MSRKDLARGADVSERYLANLETGTGNASVLRIASGGPRAHRAVARSTGGSRRS
ncbi:hypothetical protein ACTMU2_30690 [Cupriavidus basilensis]